MNLVPLRCETRRGRSARAANGTQSNTRFIRPSSGRTAHAAGRGGAGRADLLPEARRESRVERAERGARWEVKRRGEQWGGG